MINKTGKINKQRIRLACMKYLISCFALLLIFEFCNSKKSGTKNTLDQTSLELTKDTLAGYESSFFSFQERPQVIIVPSNKISTVKGKKGLVLTVDPSKLETEDGSPFAKEIVVHLMEMINQDDLFRNDATTVSDGKLLVSGGAYHIALQSGGKNLKIKKGQSLTTLFPKLTDSEMQIFYAQKDGDGKLNWKPSSQNLDETISKPEPEKRIIKQTKPKAKQVKDSSTSLSQVEALMAYSDSKGGRMSATEFKIFLDSLNPSTPNNATEVTEIKEYYDTITGMAKKVRSKSYYQPVEITNLGWINVDRFYKNSNNVKINCGFEFVNAIDKVTLYVIFKNMNSVLKEDLVLSNNDDKTYLSNFLPVGEAVRIIAITRTNDQLFTAKADLVISENASISLKFIKAAEGDLQKNILY